MRKYSSNLAFVDLLFNLLVGFTSLFVIAFLLINPVAKKGVIDPPVRLLIEMTWGDESPTDIDLYVKGPDNKIVYYANRSNGYVTLKRDDLGHQSDTFSVGAKTVTVSRNYEITTMTALPDGDYVVNVHFYSNSNTQLYSEEVKVRVTDLQPYNVHYDSTFVLKHREEYTVLVFKVVDGKIVDKNVDVSVTLRGKRTSR